MVLILVWAAVAQMDRVIRATGRVVPATGAQLVQHLEGGILASLAVQEGQQVTQGQEVASLADLVAESSRDEKKARSEILLARIARLEAEANGTQLVRPAGTSDVAWAAERDIYVSREAKLMQSLRVVSDQAAQKEAEITENTNRRKGYAAELELARQQLKIVQNLSQNASASQMEVLDARVRVERLTSQLSEADNALPRLQAAMREARSREREIRAEAQQEVRSTLSDVLSERDKLTQEEKVQTDRLSRTVVRAPISGTVNRIMLQTLGGVVKPGDTLMEITAQQSEVLIEAQVFPNDRAELALGLPVIVRVGAYDYSQYGSLKGVVTDISADTVANEQGERQFRLRVTVPVAESSKFGHPISPGMSATVDVVFGQRTILQYLIRPLRLAVNQALTDRK